MYSERMVTALTFSLARAVCERAPRLLRDLCNTMMQYTFTNTPSWLVSFTPKCNLHPKVTVACFLFSSMINVYLFLSRRKKYMIVVFGSFLSVLSVNQFGMFWICCVNKHKNAWTLTSPTKGIVIYNTLYPQVCFFLVCFGTWNWATGEYLALHGMGWQTLSVTVTLNSHGRQWGHIFRRGRITLSSKCVLVAGETVWAAEKMWLAGFTSPRKHVLALTLGWYLWYVRGETAVWRELSGGITDPSPYRLIILN